MEYYALGDDDIAAELGRRVQRLRERRGYSKQMLADALGQSAKAITRLEEHGDGSLSLLVGLLRYLGAFDQLQDFLTEPNARALELNDPRVPTEGTVMSRRRPHSSLFGAG